MNDIQLARQSVTLFVRCLEEKDTPVPVLSNVLVVMSDLCVKFTSVVDRYVRSMSLCLCHSSPVIRKQCLVVLTQLMLQDYVKIRNDIFLRMLPTMVDENSGIRDLGTCTSACVHTCNCCVFFLPSLVCALNDVCYDVFSSAFHKVVSGSSVSDLVMPCMGDFVPMMGELSAQTKEECTQACLVECANGGVHPHVCFLSQQTIPTFVVVGVFLPVSWIAVCPLVIP